MLAKILVLVASMMLSLCIFEAGSRILLDPIDVLKPEVLPDPVLRKVIVPNSAGHDAWGFRNRDVPEHADVVTIGDSMTYGFAATMQESWPSWVARLSGKSVYNLGVGGYGPVEYTQLLETRALELDPELVLVGLYFGNDLFNAHHVVETLPAWAEGSASVQAKGATASAEALVVAKESAGPREWLRRSSMTFRLLEASSVGQLVNAIGDRQPLEGTDGCHVALEDPFRTVLKLDLRMTGIDLDTPEVRDGLDLTLQFLDRMIASARTAGTEIAIVLIPSKERVLAPLAAPVEPPCDAVLAHFVASETEAHDSVVSLLDARGVRWVDPLDALTSAAARERIYMRSGDTHPNGDGYRVIADEVTKALLNPRDTARQSTSLR